MALRKGSIEIKNRILSVCVRLFLQQGYRQTPISQIIREARVSASTFQNIFPAKDGVLRELLPAMFDGQFDAAQGLVTDELPPLYIYAIETAIQLVLTERNETLRDVYLEVYSMPDTAEYIHQNMAAALHRLFGARFPGASVGDFYDMEIGSAGIMRGYMARPCDVRFTLEKKLDCFLRLSLRAYRVSESEIEDVLAYLRKIDICAVANSVLQRLFAMLEMRFDFTLGEMPHGET